MTDLPKTSGVETILHFAGDRIVPLIAAASLQHLRRLRGDGLPMRSVVRQLGIVSNGVEQLLLSACCIRRGAAHSRRFGVETRIDAGSFERLLARLADVARARPNPSWTSLFEGPRE